MYDTDIYLAWWQASLLNYAGRSVLVNSVLDSLPTYAMAAFPLPKGTIEAIDRRRRSFLWTGEESYHGSKCLIAWDQVCRSKKQGGLGIKHLQTQNTALLVKMLHRLFTQPSPWASWISKEHQNYPLGSIDLGPHWRSLIALLPLLRKHTKMLPGDGRHINFWHDVWLDGQLSAKFQALYTHTVKLNCLLSSVLHEDFRCFFVPRITPTAQQQMMQLQYLLQNVTLSTEPDEIVCNLKTKNGLISSSELYRSEMATFETWPPWSAIWRSAAPPRVKFFAWLMSKNRLPTRVNLHKKTILPTPTCELCNANLEDTYHIFLRCPMAAAFWNMIQIIPEISSLSDLHNLELSGPLPTFLSSTFFLLCCWRLWNHRNEVVFQNLPPSISRLINSCLQDAKLWAHRFNPSQKSVLPLWTSILSSPLTLL